MSRVQTREERADDVAGRVMGDLMGVIEQHVGTGVERGRHDFEVMPGEVVAALGRLIERGDYVE